MTEMVRCEKMQCGRDEKKQNKTRDEESSSYVQVPVIFPVAPLVNSPQMWWLNTVSTGSEGCGVTLCVRVHVDVT